MVGIGCRIPVIWLRHAEVTLVLGEAVLYGGDLLRLEACQRVLAITNIEDGWPIALLEIIHRLVLEVIVLLFVSGVEGSSGLSWEIAMPFVVEEVLLAA